VFGASADPYLGRGEWLFGTAARGLRSHDHYSGTAEQVQRQQNRNYVVNEQYSLDLSGSYAVTRRFSVGLALPLVRASWSIPLPINPAGPRSEQNGQGIGDVTLTGRYWMLNADVHQRGNLSLGLGLKAPTGQYDVTDTYPDRTGANPQDKAVDQSIQPGDGGWGAIVEINGFKRIGRASYYGTGTYLVNPRDTNGTPSLVVGLSPGGVVTPAQAPRAVNSVPDQYVLRTGVAVALGKSPFAAALGLRMEGLPRYDFIGGSHGFRRPGYETFAEPGFYYSRGNDTWSLSVPIGLKRNRRPDPYTGNAGDATFPNVIFLVGFTHRFGAPAGAPQSDARGASGSSTKGPRAAACADPRFDSPAEAP